MFEASVGLQTLLKPEPDKSEQLVKQSKGFGWLDLLYDVWS